MSGFATAAWTAACVFEVLALVVRAPDLADLKTMARLSALLAFMSLPTGPGPAIAAACAFTLGFAHPQLRRQPILAVLLLLLTPSCVAVLAFWPVWIEAGLAGDTTQLDIWLCATAPTAATLCLSGLRGAFASPHMRIVVGWGCSAWIIVTVWAAFGGSPWPWAVLVMPFLAAAPLVEDRRISSRQLRWAQCAGLAVVMPFVGMTAQAGPWTQGVGDSLTILRAATETSSEQQAPAVTVYKEYGLTENDTFVASAFQETAGARSRVGGGVAVRHAFWREDSWIVSLEAGAGFEPVTLLELAQDFEGHAQAEIALLAGWGGAIDGAPAYAAFALETVVRAGDLPVGVSVAAQGGVELWPGVQANLNVTWQEAQDAQDRLFAQAGVVWSLDDTFALELGVQSPDVSARDPDLQAYAGIWLRL